MNPINDQMATKDLADVQKPLDLDKSTELSNISTESLQKTKTTENVDTINQQEIEKNDNENNIDDNLNNKESKEPSTNPENKDIDEKSAKSKVKDKNVSEEIVENDAKNIGEESAENPKQQQQDVENVSKDMSGETGENPKQQANVENDAKNISEETTENPKQEPDFENDQNAMSEETAENPKQQPDVENDLKDISEETAENPKQKSHVENDVKDVSDNVVENCKQQADVENALKDISEETAENSKQKPHVEKDAKDAKDVSDKAVENCNQQPNVEKDAKDVSDKVVENCNQQPNVENDVKDISEEIVENSKQQPDVENNAKDVSDKVVENCKQQPDVENDLKDISEEISEIPKQQKVVENYPKDIREEIAENPRQQSDVKNYQKDVTEEVVEKTKQQPEDDNDQETDKENHDTKEKPSVLTEPASDEEIEDFEDEEDMEDVEDVEVPGDEEVDEIIVPDEAEAEDLTDGNDNEDLKESSLHEDEEDEEDETTKAEAEDLTDGNDNQDLKERLLHENDEDGTTKDSEIENNDVNEEENTKSSEASENDEESDKKSSNGDAKEDTSSKDCEESDIENPPNESELVTLEEAIKDVEIPLEESKSNEPNIDEDTTSQATYDPLNCTDNKEQDADDNEVSEIDKNENSENGVNEVNDENDVTEVKDKNDVNEVNDQNDVTEVNDKNDVNEVNDDNDVTEVTCDEEDDEVQFVETRNSPICIESDDDDDVINSKATTETSISSNKNKNENNRQTITTTTTTVTVPKNLIVTRTSARKSTAKPQQNQATVKNIPKTTLQIQNKSNKNKSNEYFPKATIHNKQRTFVGKLTQEIVDCIELLDSSDEESAPGRGRSTPQQRPSQKKTPQKRTLLGARGNYYKNKNNNSKPTTTSTIPNRLPHNFLPQVRQQPKKPAPVPLPPATPQSNFLNAVQLQPASVTGSNPPAFSALLSNKSVIIPNAFYGNPPTVRDSPDAEIERRYARWLENFLNQFCKPQFEPTHSCFVFLQRALKYKDFVRIKGLRNNMISHVQGVNSQLNIELMTELKTIFLRNTKKITNYGRRFCELTCSAVPGKTVALMAHGISGKVTLKTCNMDLPKSTNSAISSTSSSSSSAGTSTVTRKRQLDEDEDEYTPDMSKFKTSENGDEDSGEMSDYRKRSLRTKRTKRLDNSFSYNEDDLLAEYEIDDEDDEKLAQVEIQRKIEQKRLEAEKQRQQQVKSFESAFIQAFTRCGESPSTSSKTSKNVSTQRIRLRNTTSATATTIRQYTANNDAEDLLQATWIENNENDETQIISDDDEPKVHRIYKQQQQIIEEQEEYYTPPQAKLPSKRKSNPSTISAGRASKRIQEEIITGDDYGEENNYYINTVPSDDPNYWPKNIDSQMYVNGKYKDRCVICNLNCQRLVHHYVNEHRGCEVYNSRLSLPQIKALKQGKCTVSEVSLYKNGQFQYEAFCIFCQKTSRFMFPYWYQHFTMHTGEYAYRCTGCGMRKPTRSLLTQHQSQGCPEEGGVVQDYAHDSRTLQVDAKICNICNYVQLHRSNIVKHLHTQHNIKQILPKHIQTIVLMKTPANMTATVTQSAAAAASSSSSSSYNASPRRLRTRLSASHAPNTYIIDEDDSDITYEEILPEESQPPQINTENNYYNYIPPYMQAAFNAGNFTFEEVNAGEDLSYMICGMLDVQMNHNEPN